MAPSARQRRERLTRATPLLHARLAGDLSSPSPLFGSQPQLALTSPGVNLSSPSPLRESALGASSPTHSGVTQLSVRRAPDRLARRRSRSAPVISGAHFRHVRDASGNTAATNATGRTCRRTADGLTSGHRAESGDLRNTLASARRRATSSQRTSASQIHPADVEAGLCRKLLMGLIALRYVAALALIFGCGCSQCFV